MEGKTLGRYRIDSLLGEGGMGRVYRAFDESLGRTAALKVLPSDVLVDAGRLERFVREARTASSLNHPNVVTIYEVGSEGTGDTRTHFIAMELVEGETLRERLLRGRLDLARTLELMAQVADGLAAAHGAGVVHRDLKPENVVIARSGFVKILDFGLAKLREEPALPSDDRATAVKTTPGTVLGTLGYMSPEQARGEAVDHRSDLFSLGCMLYECVTGSRPFRGDSSVDTLHRIIYSEPQPVAETAADAPPELQRIVRKLLAKDPDQRYQSARDVAIDLRDLRRELESQPRQAASAPQEDNARRGSRWMAILAIAAFVGLAITTFLLLRGRERPGAAPAAAQATPMSITRLTNSDKVIGATISPDGEYLAYVYSDAGTHSLWVRQIASGTALELIPPLHGGFWGLRFSPDSHSIYYGLKRAEDPGGALYQISILGGASKKLLTRIDSHVNFSPDGKRLMFIRLHQPKAGDSSVVIANADGTGERVLLSKSPPASMQLFWGAPSWSPDGRTAAVPLREGRTWRLQRVDIETGRETLWDGGWLELGDVCWLPDGSGVLIIASAVGGPRSQIWMVTTDGRKSQITNDLLVYRLVNLTADGKKLVTVASDTNSAIWRTPLDGKGEQQKLSSGRYDGLRGVAMAADGTTYFTTIENGRADVWSLAPDGRRTQITAGEWPSTSVALSPDDRYLITTMPRRDDWVLMRLNRDGSEGKSLASLVPVHGGSAKIDFTPDAKWVFFDSAIDGVRRIWKVPIEEGGPATKVADGDSPTVSPDGSRLAFLRPNQLMVAPLAGGEAKSYAEASVTSSSMVLWSPDGNGLLHNAGKNDRINIWYQPLDDSAPRKVTRFDDEYVHTFALARDGRSLIVARGSMARDAVLITNFR